MRLFFLTLVLCSGACAHTGVRTACTRMPGGAVACRSVDYDAQNREAAERQRALQLNACIEGRSHTNPDEPFGDARSRCEIAIAAQVAANTSN